MGDKTIVDAYSPALDAFARGLRSGQAAEEAGGRARAAAEEGMRSTIPMHARKGRASYLGARSIGHQDPGATSTAILFAALEQALDDRRRRMIQSVRRATAILLELGSGQRRLGVTELSDRLGLAKTVYGLLRALEADEMVQRDVESGKYRLGPVLLQLGNAFLEGHELWARSMLWADSLADRTEQAVRVGIPMGSSILIVHHVFRPDTSVQHLGGGSHDPLARVRPREGDGRLPGRRRAGAEARGTAPEADGANARRPSGSSNARWSESVGTASPSRIRRPSSARPRSPPRSSITRTPWAPLGSSVRSNGFWWTASRGPIWPAPSSRWPAACRGTWRGARLRAGSLTDWTLSGPRAAR